MSGALYIRPKEVAARDADRRRERRIRFRKMGEYWFGGTCAICGNKDGPFDFDHIDPSTKKFTLANTTSLSIHVWWKELMKCQLLCKPCHTLKTKVDNYKPCVHGTTSMYVNYKCRCELCKASMGEYNRKYGAIRI